MNRKRRQDKGISDDALRLFAYLDGELDVEERRAFESAVSDDPGLASDVTAFRRLFATLRSLEPLAPSSDFKVRVLGQICTVPSLWARLRGWFTGAWTPARVPNAILAHLEGELTPRQAGALTAFLSSDPEAARAAHEWKALVARLDQVPVLRPSEGFADRVMARLAHASAPAKAPVMASLRRRLAGLWPRRRERLAALSGVAFGPTAVVVATSYMILSNPLVTPSNLLSFVWAKGAGLASGLGESAFGGVLESGTLGGAYQLIRSVSLSGPAVALGLTAFAALTLLSGWILYRNLIKVTPPMDRHYVAA